jgi:hypothetical protein
VVGSDGREGHIRLATEQGEYTLPLSWKQQGKERSMRDQRALVVVVVGLVTGRGGMDRLLSSCKQVVGNMG